MVARGLCPVETHSCLAEDPCDETKTAMYKVIQYRKMELITNLIISSTQKKTKKLFIAQLSISCK